MPAALSELARATRATYLVFAAMGFALASWASRIPQVKSHLGLDASQLGLVLTALAAGAIIALPCAGPLVSRFGSRVTVSGAAVLAGIGLITVAIGSEASSVVVMIGLLALGLATGTWDVAMNVQGAMVEQRIGRSTMARFHAAFSLGTVTGALAGAAMVVTDVPVIVDLICTGCVIGGGVGLLARNFLPDPARAAAPVKSDPQRRPSLGAWRERRTLMVGAFVVAFALAEGTGNDWISVAMINGHHAAPALGTLAYGTFLAAMTVARWTGPALLDRYGRVPVIRVMTCVAVAGLLTFALASSAIAGFVGVALWGTGAALGFPVGMSAGADDPARAASRVGVITSIGYLGFLGGPPLIGLLAQQITLLHALGAVIVVLIPAAFLVRAARPLARSEPTAGVLAP